MRRAGLTETPVRHGGPTEGAVMHTGPGGHRAGDPAEAAVPRAGLTGPPAGLAEVLAARDERAARQRDLLADTGAVVSLTVVVPGAVKRSAVVERVFAAAAQAVAVELASRGWAVRRRVERHLPTGPELQLSVAARPVPLKAAMTALEDAHPWGRLWDVDVVTADGPLGRLDVGGAARCCLVCSGPAMPCARSRRHDAAALAAAWRAIAARPAPAASARVPAGRAAAALGALASEALRTEARLAPKPGLVTALDNGAHDDMTIDHLLASADALEPWFVRVAELGSHEGWNRSQLIDLGERAERAMLAATGGVNTHRGALYVLGWLVALAGGAHSMDELAAPRTAADERGPRRRSLEPFLRTAWDEPSTPLPHATEPDGVVPDARAPGWSGRLARLASPLLTQWRDAVAAPDSHGRRAYLRHGLPGVRGEVGAGLPSVLGAGLPAYHHRLAAGWSADDALLAALAALLGVTDDTNLVSRGGLPALVRVRDWAAHLDAGGSPQRMRAALLAAGPEFVRHRWSPGGSADLLSATWFVDQLYRAGVWMQLPADRPRGR